MILQQIVSLWSYYILQLNTKFILCVQVLYFSSKTQTMHSLIVHMRHKSCLSFSGASPENLQTNSHIKNISWNYKHVCSNKA